jgi:COP9 signalosome complex subunit 5
MQQSLKRFQLENNIKTIDDFYKTDPQEQKRILKESPWKSDPHYFDTVYISVIALVKMVLHAKSGGDIEVMGSLQGKVMNKALVIMDSFALPVQGTETRVSAQNQGYEYMVKYITDSEKVGRVENVVGWYHSHRILLLIKLVMGVGYLVSM